MWHHDLASWFPTLVFSTTATGNEGARSNEETAGCDQQQASNQHRRQTYQGMQPAAAAT